MDRTMLDLARVAALGALATVGAPACESTGGATGGAGDPVVLQTADTHVVGTSESIALVEDIDVLHDGRVLVLNSVDPLFVLFDPNGGPVAMHGRTGGGPEEFGAPSGFVSGGFDDRSWVFDRYRHVLVEASDPDSIRREIPLPRDAIPPGRVLPGIRFVLSNTVRTARLGDEILLPRRSTVPESGVFSYWLSAWTADIVALDPRTGSVRTVVALADVLGDPTPHFDLTDAFLPFPLWNRLWAVCGEEIRVYDRLRNEVRGFTGSGVEIDPVALPMVREPDVDREQLGRLLFQAAVVEAAGAVPTGGSLGLAPADSVRIMDGLMARLTAPVDRIANLLPRYTDLRCDERGTLWMQPFDIGDGGLRGGSVWLRIASDAATREVRLPPRFDAFRFTTDRVWGVQRSELDVASVAWISLPERRPR
jgi:hypothetical protein